MGLGQERPGEAMSGGLSQEEEERASRGLSQEEARRGHGRPCKEARGPYKALKGEASGRPGRGQERPGRGQETPEGLTKSLKSVRPLRAL